MTQAPVPIFRLSSPRSAPQQSASDVRDKDAAELAPDVAVGRGGAHALVVDALQRPVARVEAVRDLRPRIHNWGRKGALTSHSEDALRALSGHSLRAPSQARSDSETFLEREAFWADLKGNRKGSTGKLFREHEER